MEETTGVVVVIVWRVHCRGIPARPDQVPALGVPTTAVPREELKFRGQFGQCMNFPFFPVTREWQMGEDGRGAG